MISFTRTGLVTAFALACAVGCGGDRSGSAGEADDAGTASDAKPTLTEAQSAAAQNPGAPAIEFVRLAPEDPIPGDTLLAQVRLRQADDTAQVGYVWTIGDRTLSTGEAEVVLPEDARKGETVRVEVRAANDVATSPASRAEVTVGNRAPEWKSLTLSHEGEVPAGTPIDAHAVVVDPDLDPIEYDITWVLNDEYVAKGTSFDTAELERGDQLHAIVEASDGDVDVEERETRAITIANAWPTIVSTPGEVGEDGKLFYEIEVEDADGDRRFRYELVSGPPDMTLDRVMGELRWQATRKHIGTHTVEVLVKDNYGGEARQQFDLTVGEMPAEPDTQAADGPTPAAPAESSESDEATN